MPANQMSSSVIAGTRLNFTTPCCYEVTTPTMPTDLRVGSVSSVLTYLAPTSGVNLTIHATHYPSLNQTNCTDETSFERVKAGHTVLSLSPSNTLSFTSSSLTHGLTIYTTQAGCYAIRYSLKSHNASHWSAPANTSLYVLSSLDIPPAPTFTSVAFSSSGSNLIFTFNSPTDQGGYYGSFPCKHLVAFPGYAAATCFWASTSMLIASLGSSAEILPGN